MMHSPITALTWDIWQRNRRLVWLVIGIVLFAFLFNLALADSFRMTEHELLGALKITLFAISLLLVFGIFSYTDFNPQNESIGFPHRLFVLPVSTLLLVLLPVSLGIAAIDLVYLAWVKVVFAHDEVARLELSAVLLGGYMVFYQAILWSLSGLRSLRIVLLGLLAIVFIALGFVPSFPQAPFSERGVIAGVAALSVIVFLAAWMVVAIQRSGGGTRHDSFGSLVEHLEDSVSRRIRPFDSAEAAQFWFEWRCSGLLMPFCVGAFLLLFIGPLSWYLRNDDGSVFRILAAALAMPMILALPIGKAFSKPDFWSADLSLPAFIAVRPLTTERMVAIKMKVAAWSAATSWLLVLAFLSVWLPLWANLMSLAPAEIAVSQIYGGSAYALYAIAALSILAGVLLTWRFLVSGLWIGLSGNRRLFSASALPYGLAPLVLIPVVLLVRPHSPLRVWIRDDPNRLLSLLEWIGSVAFIAKISLAAFSWRRIASQRVREYLLIWTGGTVCLIAMAILLWSGARHVISWDFGRVRNVLILGALLVMPFARLGLAPSFLARNRHR